MNCSLFYRYPLIVFLLLGLSIRSVYGINFFEGSYQQALEKSRNENKKLLLYFTAKWCGPCLYMEKNVLHSDSVTTVTEQYYVALKLDHDAWQTKPLLAQYKVGAVPTFIILNAQEVVESRFIDRLSVAQLRHLLLPKALRDPVTLNTRNFKDTEYRYEQKQIEASYWRAEVGLQAGPNFLTSSGSSLRAGYELGLLLAFTKRRVSIRPGLLWVNRGVKLPDGNTTHLHYLELPVSLSYLLRNRAFFHLPGGIRANLTPYGATLVNRQERLLNSFDYGTKLGIGSFIGQTSQIEVQLGYQVGLSNLWRDSSQRFYNRGVYVAAYLII